MRIPWETLPAGGDKRSRPEDTQHATPLARAKGMTDLARQAGLSRESLYKSLSADGNPAFATVLQVLRALGLELRAVPIVR